MNERERNESDENELPLELKRHLRDLYRPILLVPPAVDAEILARTRAQLESARRAQRVPFMHRWLAAAAGLVLCLGLGSFFWSSRKPGAAFVREDINHDGRVDILDAFALARRLAGPPPQVPGRAGESGPLPDINGDGVVDRKDVDALAARAVRLSPKRQEGKG